MTSATLTAPPATLQAGSAVGSMSMCVALLIASEFMPVTVWVGGAALLLLATFTTGRGQRLQPTLRRTP